VIGKVGLADAQLVERVAEGSRFDRLQELPLAVAQTLDVPHRVFTGNAKSIQTIRNGLRSRQISISNAETKAHWAPGKKDLD
jgi:hypothetical protein